MENMEKKAAMIALNGIFGFEPKLGHALLEHFGDAREIFRSRRDELREITGPTAKYLDRLTPEAVDEAFKEIDTLKACGADFVGCDEKGYPPLLSECPDPPIGLYYRSSDGTPGFSSAPVSIGIVGTRDMSSYGRDWCAMIVKALSRAKPAPAIVSGLAFGIDRTAHAAALDHGLPTVAVMATGIDDIYPYRHIPLAERIAATPGCALVTDYPPGSVPKAINFLRRNRIIAGMCNAVILVESRAKGGGMITARLAGEYDRDVYALPGRADDIRSEGCNILIREKRAEVITDISSLVRRIGLEGYPGPRKKTVTELLAEYYGDFPEEDFKRLVTVAEAIRRHRGMTADELAAECGMDAREVGRIAGLLEADGIAYIDLLRRCSFNSDLL